MLPTETVPLAGDLEGKVALITGAASGIGLATAHLFLTSGALGLLLIDRELSSLQAAFPQDLHAQCELVPADAASEDAISACIARALARWGRLDVAVLNAGVCEPRVGILQTEAGAWERIMRVNGLGVFLGIKHAGHAMMNNPGGSSGSIVVISSQLGLEGAPGLSVYSASKFAARGLALTAAAELGPHGIRVNTVCPGPIETPLLEVFDKADWEKMKGRTMLGRLGGPREIAEAVLWLAGERSGFCVGTTLKVDGGYSKFG